MNTRVVLEPEWAAVPLRLVLGAGLLWHAFPELGEGGAMGLLAALEAFGGLLLLAGVLVRSIALLGFLFRLVALADAGGAEIDLLYLAGFLALLATGAGPLALANAFERGSEVTAPSGRS